MTDQSIEKLAEWLWTGTEEELAEWLAKAEEQDKQRDEQGRPKFLLGVPIVWTDEELLK